MEANDVAQYLKQNPGFFEDYADVIADIFVPHPHGGHAIPIAERQIVTLREKNTERRPVHGSKVHFSILDPKARETGRVSGVEIRMGL